MAKGEKKFSTQGREARKFSSKPFKAGDYDLKLLGDTAETRTSQSNPKNPPYVNVAFQALGTAEDGGRDRRVYHNFFVSLKPGKDGSIMVDRADQIVGLSKATGQELDFDTQTIKEVECVNPTQLVKWLKANDGLVVKGHVKIQKGDEDKGFGPKNVIDSFEEGEATEEADEDEETDLDEDDEDEVEEDGDEDTEDSDDDDDEIEEDDEDDDEELERTKKKASSSKVKAKKKGKK